MTYALFFEKDGNVDKKNNVDSIIFPGTTKWYALHYMKNEMSTKNGPLPVSQEAHNGRADICTVLLKKIPILNKKI